MSKRSDGLLAEMLGNRWSVNIAPAAAATVVGSVAAPNSARSRHHLEHMSISIKSNAAATHTVTTSVREASIAGTVVWSMDTLVGAATSKEIILDSMGLMFAEGKSIHFTQDTVLAGVKATVNAAGWTDTISDY
jgi:hypothetical protein